MSSTSALRHFIQGTIRAEKARLNMTFGELSAALHARGIEQSATNLSTKVSRGNMSAQLFVAIMKTLGKRAVDLEELELAESKARSRRRPARRRS